jgi:hypothetical protein
VVVVVLAVVAALLVAVVVAATVVVVVARPRRVEASCVLSVLHNSARRWQATQPVS